MDLRSIKRNNKKSYRRHRIKMRIRKVISGTPEKPRLTVFRSNKEIYVQLIDDLEGRTLVSASSRENENVACVRSLVPKDMNSASSAIRPARMQARTTSTMVPNLNGTLALNFFSTSFWI